MYGTLKEALLYYKKLSKELREYRFLINPYNPCVTNKWTDGRQLTVVWHVDDMKVSHKNKEEVTKFIEYMKGIYGEEILVARGKKHTYVGMDLEYSSPGELIGSTDIYII